MRRVLRGCWVIPLLLLGMQAVHAHPLAPALLELRELPTGEPIRYEVSWRSSTTVSPGTALEPRLPADCQAHGTPTRTRESSQSQLMRWQLQCTAQGLQGRSIGIAGLADSPVNVILRLVARDGGVSTVLLDATKPSHVVPAPGSLPPVFSTYLGLGVEHLLSGIDHVLFLIGLLLLVRRLRLLVLTITAFTLGHSVTLALATLGFVKVNSALTELAIAVSILVLAHEVVRPRPSSLMRRWPWLMAAAFGLLHGLGFAGALAEVGLPVGEIPLALFAFNVGIELGQLLVVAIVLLLSRAWAALIGVRLPAASAALQMVFMPYLMGALAGYWCIERAVAALA